MTYPEAKKIDAVTTYLILGNVALTARTLGIPVQTLRLWKQQPWWKELEFAVQGEADQELDAKLGKRIDKALELVNDRLENGDFQYDPKSGQFVRRPVNVRDGWRVANEMIDKRILIRKQPKDATNQEAVGDILKNLANEFADMARKRLTEKVVEGEILSTGDNSAKEQNPEQSTQATQPRQEPLLNGQSQEKLPVGIQELPRNSEADPQPQSS